VHETAPADRVDKKIDDLLAHLIRGGSAAHAETKSVINAIAASPLNQELMKETATRIARIRASDEGKEGVRSFLEKRKPAWAPGD